jgi:hypothetical protein
MRFWCAVRATQRARLRNKPVRWIYLITTGHGYYPLIALVWLTAMFIGAFAITATHHDDFTTPTTAQVAKLLSAETHAPIGPGRVTANNCHNPAWDTPCLNDLVFATSVTLSPVVGPQAWSPPDGWVGIALVTLRVFAWIFVALLLAGLTGLLRKQ